MLKIDLLGEYSSLHKYLKEGLQQIGEMDIRLYSNGDGWKKISGADSVLFKHHKFKPFTIYSEICSGSSIHDRDVVQLINPKLYHFFVNPINIKSVAKSNNCFSLVAAGGDYAIHTAFRQGIFDYYMYEHSNAGEETYGKNKLSCWFNKKSDLIAVKNADVIIPSLYEYSIGYKGNSKLSPVIPFPINSDSIEYRENKVNGKIVFFHGLNRELSKGTAFIRKALERIKENYPDEVEVIIDGHMPFDKYMEVLSKTNVVLDQCCSYGYGINACISMAQGKVVMSGARKETLDAFGVEKCPIIHITPEVDQIYSQLEHIVQHKKDIPQWGYESRQYVESLHHYIKVAQQYLDAWKSTGKI